MGMKIYFISFSHLYNYLVLLDFFIELKLKFCFYCYFTLSKVLSSWTNCIQPCYCWWLHNFCSQVPRGISSFKRWGWKSKRCTNPNNSRNFCRRKGGGTLQQKWQRASCWPKWSSLRFCPSIILKEKKCL